MGELKTIETGERVEGSQWRRVATLQAYSKHEPLIGLWEAKVHGLEVVVESSNDCEDCLSTAVARIYASGAQKVFEIDRISKRYHKQGKMKCQL